MSDRIKAIMAATEDLHIAYEENKEFYKAGFNYAIEAAIGICKAYDRGFSTDAGMIRLKITELKK